MKNMHPYGKVFDDSLTRFDADTSLEHFDFMFDISNGGRIVLVVNTVFCILPEQEIWCIEIR